MRADQLAYVATQLWEYVSVCVTCVYVRPCSRVCDQDCATVTSRVIIHAAVWPVTHTYDVHLYSCKGTDDKPFFPILFTKMHMVLI